MTCFTKTESRPRCILEAAPPEVTSMIDEKPVDRGATWPARNFPALEFMVQLWLNKGVQTSFTISRLHRLRG